MTPADILARHEMDLTAWEKAFLESLARRRRDLTTKQETVFAEIRDRIVGANR